MKWKLLPKVLLIVVVTSRALNAQINDSDSLSFKADLSISGFYQKGNVETIIFRAVSNTSFKLNNRLVLKTQNSYVYQEFGNVKADEDLLSLNFLYLDPGKAMYPLALAFISTNYRREIEVRYLLGGGASFRLLNTLENRLQLSISSEYETTHFKKSSFNRLRYNSKSELSTIRGTLWMMGSYRIFNNKMILKHESYYQPSLLERDNYRWKVDIGFEFPIWNNLSMNMNFLQTFESVVMINQKRRDQFFTMGFTFKSY